MNTAQFDVRKRLVGPAGRCRSAIAERLGYRLLFAGTAFVLATVLAYEGQSTQNVLSTTDFAQVWHGAQALVAGRNPYEAVGPGRAFPWPFPLLYPGTAVLLGTLFAPFTLHWATALFVGLAAGTLAWSFSARRDAPGQWFAFASAAYLSVLRTAQWSPLLIASALTPSLGWLLACKPSAGLALFVAYPSWRAGALGGVFLALSIAVLPSWPADWLAALPSAYHMTAPVTYVTAGGPLILLGLMRWRRPEARLLVALGCIPHTTMLYESLPLFLVARRWQEGLLLAAATWVCMLLQAPTDYLQRMHTMAGRLTLLLYMPCVLMVMMRPNVWPHGFAKITNRQRAATGRIGTSPLANISELWHVVLSRRLPKVQ